MSNPVVSNVSIVNDIRGLQEDLGLPISASSTLLRLKKDALIAKLTELMAAYSSKRNEIEASQFQAALDDEGVDAEGWDGVSGGVYQEGSNDPLAHDFGGNKDAVGGYPLVAEAAPSKRRGAKPLQADDMVITVLVASNPKRDGSATAARFGLMQSGMTVGEYIAAVVAKTGTSKRARRTLRKAVAAGQVAVNHPSQEG